MLADDEREFWRYLARKAERYPVPFVPPLHKPKGLPHVRRIIGGRIRTRNDANGQAVPSVLCLYDGSSDRIVDVDASTMGADGFAREALSAANRSAYIVFARGARVELRIIAQRWSARLIELGFTVDVLMGGSRLKALILRKGKHVWYLADFNTLTGLPEHAISSLSQRICSADTMRQISADIVYSAVDYVQRILLEYFGVGLSLTISNTGLRAAARSLPDNIVKYKPTPLMVSLCRIGAGYRGGLVKGKRYRGPAWLLDLNRAYTAALDSALPWHSAFGPCELDGVERPGIFMCRVIGRMGLPTIYVGKWNGQTVETDWHNDKDGTSFLAIIPSVEVSGIRALGYDVSPGFGMVYKRTFTFGSFVRQVASVCKTFGYSSWEAKLTKPLGNGVYGKFSAPFIRRDLRISPTRPGKDWMVFVDETGWPVEDLWERQRTVYQWSQHIDIAAEITAKVRGRIYATQELLREAGGEVVAISTDAVVSSVDPAGIVDIDPELLGVWKLAEDDANGVVAGANAYGIGSKTIIPDYPNPTRADILALYAQGFITVETQVSGRPLPGRPLGVTIRKRISLDARSGANVAERRRLLR